MSATRSGMPVRISETDYKYVSEYKCPLSSQSNYFKGQFVKKGKHIISAKSSVSARDCALKLDKKLIERGFEPVNILKRKP